ncbi:MAG: site-2 protease family protein [Scytolyngbya sp. HA4215-MV1]|jgi:membrane-associated protease RseP (regulator of RpoE activity)|nr:site-2 protease family protein [Scytolyngbya sp. HA4215-MV1]
MLLLLLLGLITYFIVQRVTAITRTPAWLLWLVVMTPAIILTAWRQIYGEDKQIPPELVFGPFILCLCLYWFLIQWGRIPNPPPEPSPDPDLQSTEAATPPPVEPSTLHPLDKAEESQLQSCFPWAIYYLQNIEYRPQAIICRGQLRTEPENAYNTVSENIKKQFGDRFLIVFQEGANRKPFFVMVPNPQAQMAEKQIPDVTTRPFVAMVLLLATFVTTILGGAELAGIKEFKPDPAIFWMGLPYAIALIAILASHKFSQYFIARFYQIRMTLPYFIPVIPVNFFPYGTFGAFIQIRSPVPNRKALFDLGTVGPLVGFLVTLPFLIWGLAHSHVVTLDPRASMLKFDALNPSFSFLVAVLGKLTLGNALTPNKAIALHPVAIAGYLGLIVTAFHLMPVGQLDGGHIVHAMFGQRAGAMIGQIARLLLLILFLARLDQFLLIWAVFLFLMPAIDEPALNDVSELDNRRDFLGLAMLAVLLLIVLPAPKAIVGFLNL